jgi:hypothetical protein
VERSPLLLDHKLKVLRVIDCAKIGGLSVNNLSRSGNYERTGSSALLVQASDPIDEIVISGLS